VYYLFAWNFLGEWLAAADFAFMGFYLGKFCICLCGSRFARLCLIKEHLRLWRQLLALATKFQRFEIVDKKSKVFDFFSLFFNLTCLRLNKLLRRIWKSGNIEVDSCL
jgi:hypothetical protein